ncbi:hypothetical protein HK096_004911 [Nowakowskiella sp. JEL0078]|nr:hypothetical protein HK096_004911 [Nowakowskiella sp. JEL0078]
MASIFPMNSLEQSPPLPTTDRSKHFHSIISNTSDRSKHSQNRVSTISYTSLQKDSSNSIASFPVPFAEDHDVIVEDGGYISTDDVDEVVNDLNDKSNYSESNCSNDLNLDNSSTDQPLPDGIDKSVIEASVQSWDSVDEYIPPKKPRGRNRKQAWRQEFLDDTELDGYIISEGSLFIRSSAPFETLKYNLSTTQPERQLAVTEAVINKVLQLTLSKTSSGTQVKKKRSLGQSECLFFLHYF